MITLTQRFEILLRARRFTDAVKCSLHEFSDAHRDPTKRVRSGELCCTACGVIVSVKEAFLYEQGLRHGREGKARE